MPGDVRPARPARWVAEAMEVGTVAKDARPVVGLYIRIYKEKFSNENKKIACIHTLTKPLSTTNLIPSIVTLAYEIFSSLVYRVLKLTYFCNVC